MYTEEQRSENSEERVNCRKGKFATWGIETGAAEPAALGETDTQNQEPGNGLMHMQELVQAGGDITNQPRWDYLLTCFQPGSHVF